jgi:hypothetical protein
MGFVVGNQGNIKLRRSGGLSWVETISPSDVNTRLNRVGFESATDNLLNGDRIYMQTDDERGLAFIDPTYWGNTGVARKKAAPHINVNAMGGLRFFTQFGEAINNEREKELPLTTFGEGPISVLCAIKDTTFNELGAVSRYTFNSDRDAIDATTLSDRFREMHEAGLLSGNGTIDCLFPTGYTDCIRGEPRPPTELPLVALQLLQRIDIGSSFEAALYVTDPARGGKSTVFYYVNAVMTRAGVDVTPEDMVKCSIDFVTTGDYRLLVGEPAGYLLKEDDFRIQKESTLGALLKEITD